MNILKTGTVVGLKKVIRKNNPFGVNYAKKFSPGEMVKWNGWYLNPKGEFNRETYYGVLIEITEELVGGRTVVYARILPIHNNIICEVNIFTICKVEKERTN